MKKRPLFFYGWFIVGVGILTMALAYGSRYSFSVIFPSLEEQFGWSREASSRIPLAHLLAYGVTAPITGFLVDRLGAKRTMALGVFLLALGNLVSSRGSSLWHFYVSYGIIMGIGLCLSGGVAFTRTLSNWFVRRRGTALGLMFFGSGGPYLLLPFITLLIGSVGWRGAYMVQAGLLGFFLLPLILFVVRTHPKELGLTPDGLPQGEETSHPVPARGVMNQAWASISWTLPKALRTYRYWALFLVAFSAWGVGEHIMVFHQVAFATEAGYSKIFASSAIGLTFGIMHSVGALAGFLSDRIGRELTLTLACTMAALGIGVFMLVSDTSQPWMLYFYSIFFGLGLGLSIPTIAAAITDVFRGPRAGTTIGSMWFGFAMGGALGPWLAGLLHDLTGSYLPAFAIAALAWLFAALCLWIASPGRIQLVAGKIKEAR